jgi:hypothetical protein
MQPTQQEDHHNGGNDETHNAAHWVYPLKVMAQTLRFSAENPFSASVMARSLTGIKECMTVL